MLFKSKLATIQFHVRDGETIYLFKDYYFCCKNYKINASKKFRLIKKRKWQKFCFI